MSNQDTTFKPPIVLFQRFGGGGHAFMKSPERYQMAQYNDMTRRATKVHKPVFGDERNENKVTKEQQLKWLEMSKDYK